ncbi:endonuclease III domain-containing protein [archaeon]
MLYGLWMLLRCEGTGKEKAGQKKARQEKEEIVAACRLLSRHYGGLKPAVKLRTPFQTLVATALSARTRDANTIKAAGQLFAKYPTAKALSKAPVRDVEKLIRPVGMYKTKAKNIIGLAKRVEKTGVPKTIGGLVELPGVGRKTANCTLVYAFGIPAMCVDTHVHRITNLFGWVKTKTPEQTEKELRRIVPKKYWVGINDWLVKHGQQVCPANRPKCEKCFLNKLCAHGKKAV